MFMDAKRGPSVDPSGRRRVARISVERLEGKALMSHMAVHAKDVIVPGVLPVDISIRRFNQPGPIKNIIGQGFAVKVPRFNGYYTGPVGLPDAQADPTNPNATVGGGSALNGYLNASGAKAYIEGSNLVLTGIIAGTVQAAPGLGQEAYYNFGINRGGASRTGPFFGKPKVTFDSVVQVAVTPAGLSGTVTTFDAAGNTLTTTAIPPTSIATKTDAVQVLVPLSELPSTGVAPSRYRVSFFPSDKQVPANFNDIASVLPEFNTFPVKVLRRYPPFPNGGGTVGIVPPPTDTGAGTTTTTGGSGAGNQTGSGTGATQN